MVTVEDLRVKSDLRDRIRIAPKVFPLICQLPRDLGDPLHSLRNSGHVSSH